MSTPDQALAPIKARLEAATPGPFIVARYDHGGGRMFVEAGNGRRELIADAYKAGDVEFQAKAPADINRLLTAIEAVQKLAEKWRYKGEFGWGAWQEGHGPDQDGYVLDQASAEISAALSEALGGGE